MPNVTYGEHAPDCDLYPARWLRHAVASVVQRMEGDTGEGPVDRLSAGSLTNALEHYVEDDEWATATLLDVARFATRMDVDDRFAAMCTCGAWGGRLITESEQH